MEGACFELHQDASDKFMMLVEEVINILSDRSKARHTQLLAVQVIHHAMEASTNDNERRTTVDGTPLRHMYGVLPLHAF